jgi:predicted Rossmann fold nucleotide-binding protein DprA/Smf involved in DNA uptake
VLNHPEAEGLLEGSQRLIEDGAISITNAYELLGIFNQGSPTTTQLDSQDGSATISKPASQITIPLSELLRISNYSVSYLLQMELDGALTRLPGNSVKLSSDLFDKICSPPAKS